MVPREPGRAGPERQPVARRRTAGGSPARRSPGMRSSTARSSGRGRRSRGSAWIGIVDHRFDHIDSGRFVVDRRLADVAGGRRRRAPRGPTRRMSAHSRTDVAAPVEQRHERRPWVRCSGVTPNTSHERGVQVDGRRQRVARRRARRPATRSSSGMWPSVGVAPARRGLPQMSALAEVVAVVGADDDRGVVPQVRGGRSRRGSGRASGRSSMSLAP